VEQGQALFPGLAEKIIPSCPSMDRLTIMSIWCRYSSIPGKKRNHTQCVFASCPDTFVKVSDHLFSHSGSYHDLLPTEHSSCINLFIRAMLYRTVLLRQFIHNETYVSRKTRGILSK